MDWLIWTGTAVTLLGLAGVVACIALTLRARRAGLSDGDLRDRLQGLVPLNLASVLLSALGLMLVVLGVALG